MTSCGLRSRFRYPLAAVLFATACSGAACNADPPTVTPESPATYLTPDPSAESMTTEILNSELAVGLERVAFRLTGVSGAAIGPESEVSTEFYRLHASGEVAGLASQGPAQYFGSGLPGGGAWIVYAPFDSSGEWGFGISATRANGTVARTHFNIQVAARPAAPRVNTAPPFGDTPVAGSDLALITSDPAPDSGLYAITIDDAVASGLPTIVHFGSPGFCVAGANCTVALDEFKATFARFQGRAHFIHVETRDLNDTATLSGAAQAWGLPSEPWTFVIDRHGRIAARAEGAMDQVELGLLIDRELAKP